MKNCLFLLCYLTLSLANENCEELDVYFTRFSQTNWQSSSTIRYVAPKLINATDTPDCLCRGYPCATAKYALYGDTEISEVSTENITVILGPGTHVLNEGLPIHNASNIYFIGVSSTVVECGINPDFENCSLKNIHISNSSSIYFYGITFQNCQNDVASIHIQHSQDIIFEHCTFRNNPASGLHLFQSHSVAFRSCQFIDNIQQMASTSFPQCYGSQNDEVFFLDSRPTAGAVSIYSYQHSFKLLISNCTFTGNYARNNTNVNLPRALLSFGHGGAMFIRFYESSNSKVCIIDTVFANNTAQANGGAIQLSFAINSINNFITIYNTSFKYNKCILRTCSGGAIGMDYFQNSTLNLIHFIDSIFEDNYADAGGTLALLTSVATTHEDKDKKALWFKNCTFQHNMAKEDGSALSLFSVTPINTLRFPVFIDNCKFLNNIALDVRKPTHAVSGFRVAIYFTNFTLFQNNFGGGSTLIESQVYLINNLTFHRNFANNGGGLELYGRCLIKLYNGSSLIFDENYVLRKGGGLYIEYVRSDFIFSILNRGCFIQYHSDEDYPPNQWNTIVKFSNNTAGEAGAALYASDMSRCQWFGNIPQNVTRNVPIFEPISNYQSPFYYSGNVVPGASVTSVDLGTDAYRMNVETRSNQTVMYSYSESVMFELSAVDQLNNSREAVWQVDAPLETEPLGAISSNKTLYTYDVPSQQSLLNLRSITDNATEIEFTFSIFSVSSIIEPVVINISVSSCHPGYSYNTKTTSCECLSNNRKIVRCDERNRYFYVQEGLWVHANSSNEYLSFKRTLPGLLKCNREGNLPGCLFKFDKPDEQCIEGRGGLLCAECQQNYSLTLDLLSCKNDCSDWGAIILFIVVCILTIVFSFIVLYFDIAIPNELKGFIFFAQVIGVIYRNSSYLTRNEDQFIDFIINMFGLSLPFPVCFSTFSGAGIAWLGVVPPTLALVTAIVYIKSAEKIEFLHKKESYGLHGLNFLTLFIYKYFIDTGYTFFSLTNVNNTYVFRYTGEPAKTPLIFTMFIIGVLLIIVFTFVIPIVLLVYIYRPQKHLHLANAFTRGIKNHRKYLWYGIWDIWRRLPFVAVNLFFFFGASIILLLHCILILIVLTVHCITKPYTNERINVIETAILFCLFGATVTILDENDVYINNKKISIFFIILPFIYGLLTTIFIIVLKLIRRKYPQFTVKKFVLDKFPQLSTVVLPKEMDEERKNSVVEETAIDDDSTDNRLREPLLDSI